MCASCDDHVVRASCDDHVVCADCGDCVVCVLVMVIVYCVTSCPLPSSFQSSKWYNLFYICVLCTLPQ